MPYICFYNTENFFPPNTPHLPHWDDRKYLTKRQKIIQVFSLMKTQYHQLPTLIGLAEIGNKKVVKELLDMPVFEGKYSYVHYESQDERGIDVALAYQKSVFRMVHSEPIRFTFEMLNAQQHFYTDTTRDVLYVILETQGIKIHYFLVHLPSKRENDINLDKRNHILSEIKKRIETIIYDTNEAVIISGDFNENPNEDNMQNFIYYQGIEQILDNPFLKMYYQKQYSTFHHKTGLLFDQILLSYHFFKPDFPLHYQQSKIFTPKEILQRQSIVPKPSRTYSGTRYLGGYSDHFPVLLFYDEDKNHL